MKKLQYKYMQEHSGQRNTHANCAGVSRYTEDQLVAFDCCLIYGRVVVALTHSQFPFSILK